MIRKICKYILLFLLLVLIVGASLFWFHYGPYFLDAEDKGALEKLKTEVIDHKGEIKIIDLYTGAWDEFCLVSPYTFGFLNQKFGEVDRELEWVYSDMHWGLVFIRNNKKSFALKFKRHELEYRDYQDTPPCWTREVSEIENVRFVRASGFSDQDGKRIIVLRGD